MSQNVRTDRVALIAGEQHAVLRFLLVHIEVVEPEVDQHFFQLPVGIDRPEDFAFLQIVADYLLRLPEPHSHAPKFRRLPDSAWGRAAATCYVRLLEAPKS